MPFKRFEQIAADGVTQVHNDRQPACYGRLQQLPELAQRQP